MREAVLDASVVLKWFTRMDEPGAAAARRLRAEFEEGLLGVVVPPLPHLEILNVAGRRWAWSADSLLELAGSLQALPLDLVEPDLSLVARWVGAGLNAYDAAYLAVADAARLPLITEDASILSAASGIAGPP